MTMAPPNHPRGSLWGRWDLHVHTPSSLSQQYGGDTEHTWDRFVAALEALPEDFRVIGINDYLFLDGYRRIIEYKSQGRLANIATFLPVVEFRIAKFAGTEGHLRRINYHVIFSNTLTTDQIEQQFLNQLHAKYTLAPGIEQAQWAGVITRKSLEDLGHKIIATAPPERKREYDTPLIEGFHNLNLSVENIRAALDSPYFTGRYVTAIGKTEWASLKWNDQSIAEKKTLINNADLLFTSAATPDAYHHAVEALRRQGVNDKLLDCSDAHTWHNPSITNSLGRCDTWIKADPTFRGLQHALFEFTDRVFIGTIPPKLADVRSNPHKYLDAIQITKRPDSTLDETWFDCAVPLNPGLVAIIGNKGSGKSALADIIALGGNSLQEPNYSFLNSSKFRRARHNKAEHFAAVLKWCSGDTTAYDLSHSPDTENLERVKYIPQSYLETLCNELIIEGGGAFDEELRAVIFSHIPPAERLDKASLGALLDYLGEETFDRINSLTGELSKVNRELSALEDDASPDHKREIEKRLTGRLKELETHKAAKPQVMPKPDADPATQKQIEAIQSSIESQRVLIKQFEQTVESARQRRKELLTRLATIDKMAQRIANFVSGYADLARESAADLDELGFLFEDLVKLETNTDVLKKMRHELAMEEGVAKAQIAADDPKSAHSKLVLAKHRLTELQNQLDAPTRRYQEYLTALKQWEDKATRIERDAEDPDSILTLRAELTRIAGLPQHIAVAGSNRLLLCLSIYERITELKEHYRRLHRPVQDFIQGHRTLAESIHLSFDVQIGEQGLVDGVVDWIHQGRTGSFQGSDEGTGRLRALVQRHGFDSKEGVEAFLTEFMQALHNDDRHGPSKQMSTKAQLKANRSVAGFYDYLFSLSYLKPRYALKMEGKELFELSPGERGLLLLLFYLLVEKGESPLLLDQPEENLDNETVHGVLVPSVRLAKGRRQIIIVTHNPNLAVVCDADQIIAASIDKAAGCRVAYQSGALENPSANQYVVRYLEGTMPAFMNRDLKYIRQDAR
ncbi:MAG: TrlF family AAA-like ATPase [Candidatus Polarisedimenticolia bacterium]